MNWLSEALGKCRLTPEMKGYLLGRGGLEDSFTGLGIKTWSVDVDQISDTDFRARYSLTRLNIRGWLACPIYSPRGKVIGVEFRNTKRKALSEFLLPEAGWNPVWMGLTPEKMEKVWAGGDVWVTEGLFDMFPMEWVVPDHDVVLATLRARLSVKHVEFLRRFCTGWVHMVYDLDEAGRKATLGWVDDSGKKRWGALDSLKRVGVKCRDVPYFGGKDPGEIWESGGGVRMHSVFDPLT